jgi:hypothetical protein
MARISTLFARWFRRGPGAEEKRLLRRCAGDPELTERLIGHELARRPGLSRAAAAESAEQRWNRDR